MPNIAVIRARRAEISKHIARLKAEDEELAAVEQVLKRLSEGGGAGDVVTLPGAALGRLRRRSLGAPRSQREFVLDALETSDSPWLRSDEIIEHVTKNWGVAISERSLRPLLSVMKRDGQVVRQGRMLALPQRANAPKRQRTPR